MPILGENSKSYRVERGYRVTGIFYARTPAFSELEHKKRPGFFPFRALLFTIIYSVSQS